MDPEKLPLLSSSVKQRQESREFVAFDLAREKSRRHSVYSIILWAVILTLSICLLLTPLGCILSSMIENMMLSFQYFLDEDVLGSTYMRYPEKDAVVTSNIEITNNTLRVVLLGDSLINRPYELFNLSEKIQSYISQYDYTFDISNCGFNGQRIETIRSGPLVDCALPKAPHAVIVFWDSDCSNVSEYDLSESDVATLRAAYKSNVESVIETLLQTGRLIANISVVFVQSQPSIFFSSLVVPSDTYCTVYGTLIAFFVEMFFIISILNITKHAAIYHNTCKNNM